MPLLGKGSEAKRIAKRTAVAEALNIIGLKVDDKGNVLEGGAIIGSLTPEGDFHYPPHHEHWAMMDPIKTVMWGLGRSTVRSEEWEPNA